MGIKGSPCGCCECPASFVDEFNRTSIGSDWTTVGGTWSANGTALTGSGGLIYCNQTTTSSNAATRFKLDSGTVKVCLIWDVFTPRYEYVELGDGEVKYYTGGPTAPFFRLVRTTTGAPTTGNWEICFNHGSNNLGSNFAHVAVKGPSDFYDQCNINDGGFNSSGPPYDYIGFDASSSVSIDKFELLDADECCPKCPSCVSNHWGKYGSDSLVIDFGDRSYGNCLGPAPTLTGEYILDGTPTTDCSYYLVVSNAHGSTTIEAHLGGTPGDPFGTGDSIDGFEAYLEGDVFTIFERWAMAQTVKDCSRSWSLSSTGLTDCDGDDTGEFFLKTPS